MSLAFALGLATATSLCLSALFSTRYRRVVRSLFAPRCDAPLFAPAAKYADESRAWLTIPVICMHPSRLEDPFAEDEADTINVREELGDLVIRLSVSLDAAKQAAIRWEEKEDERRM